MAYQFDYDSTNRILRCRVDGHVTDEVLKEFYRVAAASFAQMDPYRAIIDLSGVTSSELSPQAVSEVAGSAPPASDVRRLRVIFAPSGAIFELACMFQFEGDSTRPNWHVVRTLKEAWAVLGVQEPQFKRLHET